MTDAEIDGVIRRDWMSGRVVQATALETGRSLAAVSERRVAMRLPDRDHRRRLTDSRCDNPFAFAAIP